MGQVTAKTLLNAAPEFELAGVISRTSDEHTYLGTILGNDCLLPVERSLDSILASTHIDAAVIFSLPSSAMEDTRLAMKAGIVPVIGTTGLKTEDINEIESMSSEYGIGAIISPNFSIGSALMMKFAAEVSKYLPSVEIVEMHRQNKLDAPSGTAIKTAEMIQLNKKTLPIAVHSLRLPGFVAHQEVLFGGSGQTLKIRHDSYSVESFMPGLLLALHNTRGLTDVVYGLENMI